MGHLAQAKTTMNDLRKAMHKTRGDALTRQMYKTVAHAKSKHGTCLTKRRTERKQKLPQRPTWEGARKSVEPKCSAMQKKITPQIIALRNEGRNALNEINAISKQLIQTIWYPHVYVCWQQTCIPCARAMYCGRLRGFVLQVRRECAYRLR